MGAPDELRIRLEGRVERLEAAAERYDRLGRLIDPRWVEKAGTWRALAAEVVEAEEDVGEALSRVQRHPELEDLARDLLERRQRLVDEVKRLAEGAGLAPAPWTALLSGLSMRAGAAEAVELPRGLPLVRGPVASGFASVVAAIAGALSLVAAFLGDGYFEEDGVYLGLVPAGLGLAFLLVMGPRPSFAVHGRRLIRPGRAGQGFTLDLAQATSTETALSLRLQAEGLSVEVPATWDDAGFLRALVEAAKAGLLDGAERLGPRVTVPGAWLGPRGGALLGWGELVLFVTDLAAPAALASLTGRPELPGVDAKGLLALVEVLDAADVRRALPGLERVDGVRVWAREQCRISPFPPYPRGKHQRASDRTCPLEVACGAETIVATLTWTEARDVAMSLGLMAPS